MVLRSLLETLARGMLKSLRALAILPGNGFGLGPDAPQHHLFASRLKARGGIRRSGLDRLWEILNQSRSRVKTGCGKRRRTMSAVRQATSRKARKVAQPQFVRSMLKD